MRAALLDTLFLSPPGVNEGAPGFKGDFLRLALGCAAGVGAGLLLFPVVVPNENPGGAVATAGVPNEKAAFLAGGNAPNEKPGFASVADGLSSLSSPLDAAGVVVPNENPFKGTAGAGVVVVEAVAPNVKPGLAVVVVAAAEEAAPNEKPPFPMLSGAAEGEEAAPNEKPPFPMFPGAAEEEATPNEKAPFPMLPGAVAFWLLLLSFAAAPVSLGVSHEAHVCRSSSFQR